MHSVRRVIVALLAVSLVASGLALAASRPVAAAGAYALPADVTPKLAKARKNKERLLADGCVGLATQTVPKNCVYGNKTGSYTVALVGDSHASHLFPALEWVALQRGWRLVVFVKVSCQLVDFLTRYPSLNRKYPECQTWNENVVKRLNAAPPDLTIVAMSHWIYPVKRINDGPKAEGASVARMLGKLPGRRILVADSLMSSVDVPACLANNLNDIRPCATSREKAFRMHGAMERRAAEGAGVPLIDLAHKMCPGDPCSAVVNKMIVYRDYHHLTATFSRSLGPELQRLIEPLR